MADNYLERHREEYEHRKNLWILSKHKNIKKQNNKNKRQIERPEDEAL